MSYSRKQLYAMGEPLGECVTRKEGGRIIYGGGGGGSSQQSTQVTDLPEWARGYAQRALGMAEGLTTTKDPVTGQITGPSKFQKYTGERIAPFEKLQETAFTGAGALTPSGLSSTAGEQASAATGRALGAGYDPFQMGQFTGDVAGQYMNPYLEQAMAPQIREAQRASDIQRQADQARAVGAGAFGGSRQAIVEAERQRNLGTQIGDIRARGYASAFDQAQQQFAREQQLREQSRQYGAGLGMQGLQTALQGAGLMGQLGGQQFGQQRDIIGLQTQLGALQQQQEQAKRTQDYQDFLSEERYPYQQLEFMSNILRGTPMGSVSTLYAPPPNTAGQIAGIGAGLYGTFGRAGGGMVGSYADGGSVTSDQSVENILDKLSTEQLRQSRQIALAQRNMERVQMIDAELAERASMEGGLGMAFNQLPQEQQDNVMSAASGGIVAFANGGPTPEEIEAASKPYVGRPMIARPSGKKYEDANIGQRILNFMIPPYEAPPSKPAGTAPAPAPAADVGGGRSAGRGGPTVEELTAYQESERLAKPPPKASTKAEPSKAPAKSVSQAASALAEATEAKTGLARTPMKTAFAEGLELLKDSRGEEDSRRMVELINRISKSDAPDKMDMLASVGFRMAAAASKPGAKFAGSLVEGLQAIPEMKAQAKKEAREAQRLGATLEMEKLKLDAANRKGDRAAALQHAQNIRIMEGQEAQLAQGAAQLAETRRANIAREGLQAQQIAVSRGRAAAAQGRIAETMTRVRAANAQKALADARKAYSDPLERKRLEAEYGPGQAGFLKYQKSLFDSLQLQSLPQLELLSSSREQSAED